MNVEQGAREREVGAVEAQPDLRSASPGMAHASIEAARTDAAAAGNQPPGLRVVRAGKALGRTNGASPPCRMPCLGLQPHAAAKAWVRACACACACVCACACACVARAALSVGARAHTYSKTSITHTRTPPSRARAHPRAPRVQVRENSTEPPVRLVFIRLPKNASTSVIKLLDAMASPLLVCGHNEVWVRVVSRLISVFRPNLRYLPKTQNPNPDTLL